VAIDVAKARHQVLIELADGKRTALSVGNTLAEFNKLADRLELASPRCEVALEPTGDYHRPLANFLVRRGHNVQFVSSIATSRTREALYNSWDKNDPKDAQVILHLLKGGVTQRYADPLQSGYQDLQELLGTYSQVVRRKTPVKGDEGRPTLRRRLVSEYYETARESVGIPIEAGSIPMQMFRTILQEHIGLTKLRQQLEKQIHQRLEEDADYQHLRTIPGIGPIVALTILSEAGDLRRKAYSAVAAKMARVSYGLIKSGGEYRHLTA